MGMFDWVAVPDPLHTCPKCGARVDGFQSKSGPCQLEWVAWNEVDNFYASCRCGAWIAYTHQISRRDTGTLYRTVDRETQVALHGNGFKERVDDDE